VTETKRTTIYLDPELHRALRLRSAAADVSISAMVNDAVRLALAEDAIDLEASEVRESEPALDFETVVRDLKRRGRL
jgi:thiamine monophosphate synthase